MFENFLRKLANDVYDVCSKRDTDHPKCPQCGKRMNFIGGDLPEGEGHWDCNNCGYSFTENEMNEYLD